MAKNNKRKNPARGRAAISFAGLFGGIYAVVGGAMIGQQPYSIAYIIAGIIMVILGIYFLIDSRKIATIDNMITGGVTKLDDIALSSRMSYDRVFKIINKLIAKGEYTDIYLDLANREIVHKSASAFSKPVNNITCPNCHATTSDKNGVCEFCGASLK